MEAPPANEHPWVHLWGAPTEAPPYWTRLVDAATEHSIAQFLEFLPPLTRQLPQMTAGACSQLWHVLINLASLDIAAARALEPHLDAQEILAQAAHLGVASPLPIDPQTVTWGVFAARTTPVTASCNPGGRWTVDGTKSWCSLANHLDWALVTADVPDGYRLFAIDLHDPGVTLSEHSWAPMGLPDIPSLPLVLNNVTAYPVGEPGWYLKRPGFAWGGMGVAACWLGGALGLHRHLLAPWKREPDQIALAHIGQSVRAIHSAAATLARAAHGIDTRRLNDFSHAWGRALAVRGTIAESARRVCALAAELAGPAGLAFDKELTQRRADLELYLSQHKGARDDASIGHRACNGETLW